MSASDILYSQIKTIQKPALRPDKDLIELLIDQYRRGHTADEILRRVGNLSRLAQESGRVITYNGYTCTHEDREKNRVGHEDYLARKAARLLP
jgi:hypothetical protein